MARCADGSSSMTNLRVIDAKWEQVELQTSWKLEPCFRLAPSPIMQDPSNKGTAVDELSVTPHNGAGQSESK